ncbi:hypothetical protein SLS60_000295 [Paraconiothyrium brasiliense]|uniref:DUF7587 domain-containing protein n=1 Tax=Paraconiothyrium brasiliense TaxID=300254 RepID=A0ABR3S7A3_9PLEO
MAFNMIDPHIAVINCEHLSVTKPYQQLKASEVLRELKSLGQAQWAKYRGVAEKIIFGSVPAEAIIYHGSLSEMASIVTAEPGGSLFLNPNDFQPDQTVRELAEKLKDRNLVLDDRLARVMGIWAKTMGLDSAAIPSSHMIREFVQVVLTDGWTIRFEDDIHTRASLAMTFAHALGSETFRFQQVIEAFIAGLERT